MVTMLAYKTHRIMRILTIIGRHSHKINNRSRLLRPCMYSFQTFKGYCATEPLPPPHVPGEQKTYDPKLERIVDEISKLTLVEVSDLNSLLKQKLNIQDAPVMQMAGAVPAAAPEEEEEVAPRREKTSFTVKLVSYDETKKITVIKEIKNLIPDINLVQAKKFIEAVPQVVKGEIMKEEAEKLKAALEAVGGVVELE